MSERSYNKEFGVKAPQSAGFENPLAFLLEMRPEGIYGRKPTEPQLVFVCRGTVSVVDLDGEGTQLERDNFSLIMPGTFVSLTALEESTVLVCRLRSERQLYERLKLANLAFFKGDESIGQLPVNEDLGIFLDGFIHFLKKGFSSARYHEGKISELLYILRECYPVNDLAGLFSPLLGTELAFKNFVFSTVRKVGSVSEMAAKANMSPTGFRSKFVKIMGESPSEIITRYKAEMVRRDLLYTDMPLKEISEKYGFNSIHVFTRFCTRELGQSPGNLRKSGRK
ncbi:MAG: helix-turn-helix transcriptional regulator [Rikenellaceae bacterium]|nr:helix-turn-helix transcriptional regulator [Rikenellaceae bacterium]